MNSSLFTDTQLPGVPTLPNIHYYNNSLSNKHKNSADTFKNNMKDNCSNFTDTSCSATKECSAIINDFYDGKITDFVDYITDNKINENQQIKYLTCQLARARAREYSSDNLNVSLSAASLKEIFTRFSNLKPYLIIIFFLTIYLLIYGFFSSLDICVNVLNSIKDISVNYWLGLLAGLVVPFIILTWQFSDVLCNKIASDKKYNITTSATGTPVTISGENKTLDYSMISIFLIAIFAFTALLFTLKKDQLGEKIYFMLVSCIFVILAVFVYLFYSMTPYFVTANQKNMMKKDNELKIYVNSQTEESPITTNKDIDDKVHNLYLTVITIIFVLACLFFVIKQKGIDNGFVNGLFGAGALLILPILWVVNYTVGIRYFYVYPVFLILMRFIRYAGMIILYFISEKISEKNSNLLNSFSSDFKEELDNIKNYSPSWGLFGVDLLKTIMNICGFNNEFSKKIVSNNNINKNMSQDKYFTSLIFFRLLLNNSSDKTGLIYSIIILVLSIIIGSIILGSAGIFKKDDVIVEIKPDENDESS